MTHKTPDELRRLVQDYGPTPIISETHPEFIVNDPRLAYLWGRAREALREYDLLVDEVLQHMGVGQ